MSFVVSVDGQAIPTDGITALIKIGIPPVVGSVNEDFITGVGTNWVVNQIKKLWDGYVVAGTFSSYDKSWWYSPSQFRWIAPLTLDGDVLSSYTGWGLGFTFTWNTVVNEIYKLSTWKYIWYGRYSHFDDNPSARLTILDSNFAYDILNNNMWLGITPTGAFSNTPVNQIIEQSDWKIIVVGAFSWFNWTTQNRITRLNADFTLDTTFATNIWVGANATINAVWLQSDWKIIIGGAFTSFNGTTRNRITRLNADGTHDTTFTQGTGMSSTVNVIHILSDDRVVVWWAFITYAGTARQRILILNSTGTIDTSFNTASWLDNQCYSIGFFDNKLYISWRFDNYKWVAAGKIVSINLDATRNATFVWSFTLNILQSRTIDCDSLGNIYIWWTANTYNWVATTGVVKVSPTWNIISTFGSWFNSTVLWLKIFWSELLVSGQFTTFQGNKAINWNFFDRLVYLNKNWSTKSSLPKWLAFTSTPLIDTYNDEMVTTTTTYNWVNYWKPIKILADWTIWVFDAPAGTHSIIKYNSAGKVYIVWSTIPWNIQRYNNDWTVDATFTWLWFNWVMTWDVYELSDGRVCVCIDWLTTYNSIAVNHFLILNNDWTFNSSFVLTDYNSIKIDCIVEWDDIYVAYLNNSFDVTIQKIWWSSVSITWNLGNMIIKGNRIFITTNHFIVGNLHYFVIEYDLNLNLIAKHWTMPFDALFTPLWNYICKDWDIWIVGWNRTTFSWNQSKNIIAINI